MARSKWILVALALLFTTGWTYKIERPDDYPFTGNLEKREAWQEKALRHARSDLKDLKGGTVLLVADQKLATEAAESEVQQWIGIVKRELGQTRDALQPVVSEETPGAVYDYTTGQWTIPAYIVMCESGGDYGAVNPSSGAYGAYQIMPFHWSSGVCQGLGMDSAGQDECAARIWNSAGAGAWACA